MMGMNHDDAERMPTMNDDPATAMMDVLHSINERNEGDAISNLDALFGYDWRDDITDKEYLSNETSALHEMTRTIDKMIVERIAKRLDVSPTRDLHLVIMRYQDITHFLGEFFRDSEGNPSSSDKTRTVMRYAIRGACGMDSAGMHWDNGDWWVPDVGSPTEWVELVLTYARMIPTPSHDNIMMYMKAMGRLTDLHMLS